MPKQLRHIGYMRLSPANQHPDVQTKELRRVKYSYIHQYTNSGPLPTQKALQEVRNLLNEGDQLIVYRRDHFIRDEYALADFWNRLEAMGVKLLTSGDQETIGNSREK